MSGALSSEDHLERAMHKTVLIVEDDYLNMMFYNDVLEAHGYATLQATDGAPVLAMAREHKPDLILMDMQLPGASGMDITRSLKQDHEACNIPVVAVTAMAMRGDEAKIRAAGCDGYLSKPIGVAGFIETVRRHIG